MAFRPLPTLGTKYLLKPGGQVGLLTSYAQLGLMKVSFAVDLAALPHATGGLEVCLYRSNPGRAGDQSNPVVGTGYSPVLVASADWIDPVPVDDGNGGYVDVVNRYPISWNVGADWSGPVVAVGLRIPSGSVVASYLLPSPVDISSVGVIVIPRNSLTVRIQGEMVIPSIGSAMLQYLFGKGTDPLSRPSAGVYVAQLLSAPAYDGTLVEASGGGYSRRLMEGTRLEVIDDGVGAVARLQAGQAIVFAASANDWTGPWTHAIICRDLVGANGLYTLEHPAPVTPPPSGESHSIIGSSISWRLV